ncbi:MAG: SWIM zinc finger family protein [bacterium]
MTDCSCRNFETFIFCLHLLKIYCIIIKN